MKSKIVSSCLFLLIILSTSCKKDSLPNLVGQWITVSYYRNDNGTFNWITSSMVRFPDRISFNGESRFFTFTDVAGVSGTYIYDRRAKKLTLNIEADPYGNIPSSEIFIVEKLDNDRLIVAHYYPAGVLANKTEYARND